MLDASFRGHGECLEAAARIGQRATSGTKRQYAQASGRWMRAALARTAGSIQPKRIDSNTVNGSTMLSGAVDANNTLNIRNGNQATLMALPQAGQGIRRAGPIPSFRQHEMTASPQCGHA